MQVMKKFLALAVCTALLSLAAASPAAAQDSGLSADQKSQIEAITREYLLANPDVVVDALQKYQEDQQAEQARQQEQSAKPLITKKKDDHIYGNPDAQITLIEYSDFECPFCKRFHSEAKAFVDGSNGTVNWVYRHLPLPMHSAAMPKALASECAYAQGGDKAFWAFTDADFEQGLSVGDLGGFAEKNGLDKDKLQECIDNKTTQDRVLENMKEASDAGINGTPGNILVNNKTARLEVISGAVSRDTLKDEMQKLQD